MDVNFLSEEDSGTDFHKLVSRRRFPDFELLLEEQLSSLITGGGSGLFKF